ncbi:MAG: hypothetical protein QQW96_20895 [Tychonema bourrellyi B0820]|uniref:hypothetical protein n=1 Tax=Tychonema bourrellyi TaxID=54313 RepID=UPI00117F552E|nr:hypothetical protein [Tychonema bourrellyi]MDQ2100093.1 hypothetical protein [Tychonema bourrellyi B0820]
MANSHRVLPLTSETSTRHVYHNTSVGWVERQRNPTLILEELGLAIAQPNLHYLHFTCNTNFL